jgi:prepilin-type N-terminal cleavage/methylation domain-containing protein/prepilin-type processing-associated H-X9-DG protein
MASPCRDASFGSEWLIRSHQAIPPGKMSNWRAAMAIGKRPARSSLGFTLVELLIVVALMAIMAAIAFPGLYKCRERMRRYICEKNLSQLIIAVHNYETAFGVYPAGTIDATGPVLSQQSGYHHNWISRILPHLEQGNLYRAIDWKMGVYAKSNGPVRAIKIQSLICPNSPSSGPISSYAAVHNDVESPIDTDNHGVFFLNSRLRRDDILDGSSQTVFIGEKIGVEPIDLGWMSGTRATLRNMGTPLRPEYNRNRFGEHYFDEVDYSNVQPFDERWFNELEILPRSGVVRPGDRDAPGLKSGTAPAPEITKLEAKRPRTRTQRLSEVGGFEQNHGEGVQFAFGDGSVRLLSIDIATAVRLQLAHRSDGQLLAQEP